MNRAMVWVVAGFIAVCAVGLWLTRLEEPLADSPVAPYAEGETGARQELPSLATRPPAEPESDDEAPPPSGESPEPEEAFAQPPHELEEPPPEDPDALHPSTQEQQDLHAALAVVQPLLEQCLADVSAREPGPHRIVARLRVVNQGGVGRFERTEIQESTVQDPHAQSCIQDSFEDARFSAPSSPNPVEAVYPFIFPGPNDEPPPAD